MNKLCCFKVFQKGEFYDEKNDIILTEMEFEDNDICQAVMQRNNKVLIIERGMYDEAVFHTIENDEDELYRVERYDINEKII